MANLMDTSPAKQGVLLETDGENFEPCRAIHVTAAGSATLTFVDGGEVAFSEIAAGLYPYCIKKFSAGTAEIVALY